MCCHHHHLALPLSSLLPNYSPGALWGDSHTKILFFSPQHVILYNSLPSYIPFLLPGMSFTCSVCLENCHVLT